MQEIFTRTSVRNYLDKPVEKEKIKRLLALAKLRESCLFQRGFRIELSEHYKGVMQKWKN